MTGLHDSTINFRRVYAYNDVGKSSYTDCVNFTTVAGGKDSELAFKLPLSLPFVFYMRYFLFHRK